MEAAVFGRDRELEIIERLLDALESRPASPSALVFEGEAGSGKTTLVRAAIEAAGGRGAIVLACAPGEAEAGLSYAALGDLCRTVEREALGRLLEPQRDALEVALLRRAPGDATIDHRTVATGALSLLEYLAAEAPVVVAIDDSQWLDPPTARLVAFCARRVAGSVGFIVSRRPPDGTAPAFAWREPDRVEVRRLGPLASPALGRMLAARAPSPLSHRDLARIEQASGGNPFYALELARALHANGALLPLPPSLEAVVASHIDGVGRDVEDVLLAIAMLAAPTIGVLIDLFGPGVETQLEEGERAGLLELDGDRVRLSHPLLSSGVYARAPTLRRRAMHRRASAVVTEPEERARHLAHTDAPGEALPALDRAARQVRARGAPDAAAELLELAISLGGGPELRVRAAEHHLDVGELGRARELLAEAIAALPAGRCRAKALMLLGEIRYTDESVPAGRELLERAHAEASGDERLLLMIELRLVYLLCTSGLVPEGDAMAASALARAEKEAEPALLAQALAVRAIVDVWTGRALDERRLRSALELEDFGAHTPAELYPSWIAAKLLMAEGRLGEAQATLDRARVILGERGAASAAAWARTLTSFIECWRGDLQAAAVAAEELAAEADSLMTAHGRAMALSGRARVDVLAGRVDEARRHGHEALAVLQQGGWLSWAATVQIALGWLELSLGDHEAAAEHLEPLAGLAFATQLPDPPGVPFVADTVEAFVGVGRLEEAEALVSLLERRAAARARKLDLALSARARGLVLAARGNVEAAEGALERALVAHEDLAMPIERARSLLVLGGIRRRLRRRRAGKEALEQALAIFDAAGTPLWAARAKAEIACLGLRPRTTDHLTPSEHRVAQLAARGLTNREVAAALVVSPKTVEAHLGRAYRKLGIRSRAQLGVRMSRLQAADASTTAPAPISDVSAPTDHDPSHSTA